jgi:putative ABC transport system permease protein
MFRQFRRRPAATLAAVLTLALGAGLNLALFRVVYAVMLKPLPYADPQRLVNLWRVDRLADSPMLATHDRLLPDGFTVERWQQRAHTLSGLASYRPWRVTVASGGDPERAPGGLISSEFLPLLGVRPLLGRDFTPEDNRPGAAPVALLSHAYWQGRFQGDPRLVGASIVLDGKSTQVVGILPAGFSPVIFGVDQVAAVYEPLVRADVRGLDLVAWVVGRLAPGVTIGAAQAELAALAREAATEHGQPLERQGVNVTPLEEQIGRTLRPALRMFFAATVCVLLIACLNVAALLLAQALERQRELSIRAALGASRWRLLRQLLGETLALAAAGAVLGAAISLALVDALRRLYPGSIPRLDEGGTGAALAGLGLLVALVSTLACGAMPALLATRGQLAGALHGRGASLGPAARRWSGALVAIEMGVTVMVLVSAGLLLKSFLSLRSLDPGFAREGITTAQVVLPGESYGNDAQTRFAGEWLARLNAIPGVTGCAVTNTLPLAFNLLMDTSFRVPGQPEREAGARAVAGDYFQVMGLRMKEGRPLTSADDARRDVVVVNEAFVRQFLPRGPTLGAPVDFFEGHVATIVGVVKDLRNMGLQRPAVAEIYMPFGMMPNTFLDVVVRTAADPAGIVAAARAELKQMDPQLALAQVSSMERVVDDSIARPRFQAVLLGLFAITALLLAAVGAYGVIAQSVRARTAEFGIRMALGAGVGDVYALVLWQGLRAPLAGLLLGGAASLAAGRLLESLLFGVTPRDAQVLSGAAALLAAVAVAACSLPARQAAHTDPASALRAE